MADLESEARLEELLFSETAAPESSPVDGSKPESAGGCSYFTAELGTHSVVLHPRLEDPSRAAAWSDDDSDGAVDITSVPRLRKLRDRHDESIISQNEYTKRLRTQ